MRGATGRPEADEGGGAHGLFLARVTATFYRGGGVWTAVSGVLLSVRDVHPALSGTSFFYRILLPIRAEGNGLG
jgi:hypothetical protein